MLLTVPVLYYKPIQEAALKINRGTKKEYGKKAKRQVVGEVEGGGVCEGPESSKAVSFMFKGTFLFP